MAFQGRRSKDDSMCKRTHHSSVAGCGCGKGRRSAGRSGMTLIELLFVLLVIFILISLLLPALQYARETARYLRCEKNMMQLVLAVKLYQETHQYYPPGVIDKEPGPILSQPQGMHHNWISQVLPQMQEELLYRQIDFRLSVYHPLQAPVRTTILPYATCPSFSAPPTPGRDPWSNYAAVHHDVEAPISGDNNGMFFLNSALSADDVDDGLSYTLFLGEIIPYAGSLGWMSGTRATLRNLGQPLGMTALLDLRVLNGQSQKVPKIPPTAVGGFGGVHKGTTLFAYGDGHVQKIANTADPRVLQRLANRKDGEQQDVAQFRSSGP